jgi:hypothetical protein
VARRVYLHVGTMKSGTSFLQEKLLANRDGLRAQGVLFPGAGWESQVRAVQDVLGTRRNDVDQPARLDGAWERLRAEIAAWDGDVVVSMELLAACRPRRARRIVQALQPAEVHVVVTARDLGRTLPAMWQESVQTYRSWTWEEYVAGVTQGDPEQPGPAYSFFRQQDLVAIVRKWRRAAGRDNLTLVTVPPPGAAPDELWHRFCAATGIDPQHCPRPGRRDNQSLGAVSAEMMRRLNVALADSGIGWGEYSRFVKRPLAKRVLASRRATEPPIGFTRRSYPKAWLAEQSARTVARLTRAQVRVVGDLADLTPVRVLGSSPSSAPVEAQLEAAVAGLASVLRRQVQAARARE